MSDREDEFDPKDMKQLEGTPQEMLAMLPKRDRDICVHSISSIGRQFFGPKSKIPPDILELLACALMSAFLSGYICGQKGPGMVIMGKEARDALGEPNKN